MTLHGELRESILVVLGKTKFVALVTAVIKLVLDQGANAGGVCFERIGRANRDHEVRKITAIPFGIKGLEVFLLSRSSALLLATLGGSDHAVAFALKRNAGPHEQNVR